MQGAIANSYLAYALMLTLVGSIFSAALPLLQPSYASHENITVEVDDDIDTVYEEAESVVIMGSIEDVQTDLDTVEITVRDGGGSSADHDSGVDILSDDTFEFVFDVTSSDDDGVYSVEVEYNSESFFTYFIVDNDNDAIDFTISDNTYSEGDTVDVLGEIETEATGETEVEYVVLAPDNGEFADDTAELGTGSLGAKEFEFDFDLDNADHGRYALIVSYDNEDQQGFFLFEVEDEGTGGSGGGGSTTGDPDSGTDGDITAEMGEAAYPPSDIGSVSGNIDSYDNSIDLEIVVENPSEEEIAVEDNVDVQSDGDFDFDFTIPSNADEGEYSVIISYGTDELVLNFDVDEDATGGGGSTTTTITAKLNKNSYLAGELITVTGIVPKLVEDEVVSVLLYRPDGRVVLDASKYVEPESDRTYSASVRLDSDLEEADEYSIKVGYAGNAAEVEFDITGKATSTGAITIETDKATYGIGSTVRITGSIADDLIVEGEQVLLRIDTPERNPCRFDPVDLESDGSFSYSLVLGGKCGITGEYEIIATYNQEQGKATFELTGGQQAGTAYNLVVEGKTHEIEYEISGGSIKSMFVRPDAKQLVVSIDAQTDGQLTLVLPREVIDASAGGTDVPYVVSTTDIEAGDAGIVDINEDDVTNNTRTIVIDYEAGTDLIEITGTTVVPEFGTIAAIVLAVSIIGIIVATTRFGGSRTSSLFRQ